MITKKKTSLLAILVTILMVFAMMPMTMDQAQAETAPITVNGVIYKPNEDGTTATVTGYTADLQSTVTIQSSVGDGGKYTVTSIGNIAFNGCSSLGSITIPASVTSIGENAFNGCTSLLIVHYTGTQDQWDNMPDRRANWAPSNPAVHFVSETITTKATLESDGTVAYICSEEGCSDWRGVIRVIRKPVSFELSQTEFTYDGEEKKPDVTVTDSAGMTIDSLTNYDVTYANNINVGTATVKVSFKGDNYTGTAKASYKINKAANPLTMKGMTATVKYKKLKKKAQTLTVKSVITFEKNGQGKMTYTLSSAKKKGKNFKKSFKVNANTGSVKIRKKLKKGTYKVTVKVKVAGNANYNASTLKTVVFKVKIN